MEGLSEATYRVVGDYDIHLVEAGSGPAVVFLHGSGPGASGASNFRDNWQAFVAAGYRVILPDLIGYGASSKPEGIDYTLQLFADTVFEALQAHGVKQASLVGNSLGGGIALQIALDHPGFTQSFVLMAPGCIEEQAHYFTMPGIARMVSNFGGPDFNLDEQRRLVRNLVHPDFADCIPDALVQERFAVARTQPKDVLMRMRTPNLAPRLGELAQPMLVMWGLQDDFCPESGARHFLAAGCNVRTMTFNQVGHWVQVERAAEFNAHAIAFLKGCGA
jgi:4,5:9,10-diseco-3-hydroxy-5,9,17-trioxoandrosta-1(10),2-diene-4-oate hydrolase